MQLCCCRRPIQLECGQVAGLALGFGFVNISSEIGPSPAANGSAVAPRSHPGLSPNPSSPPLSPVGRLFLGKAWLLPPWSAAPLGLISVREEIKERIQFKPKHGEK